MGRALLIMQIVLGVLPQVLELIKALETIMPAKGTGAARKDIIMTAVKAAMPAELDSVVSPKLNVVIDKSVDALKSTGNL